MCIWTIHTNLWFPICSEKARWVLVLIRRSLKKLPLRIIRLLYGVLARMYCVHVCSPYLVTDVEKLQRLAAWMVMGFYSPGKKRKTSKTQSFFDVPSTFLRRFNAGISGASLQVRPWAIKLFQRFLEWGTSRFLVSIPTEECKIPTSFQFIFKSDSIWLVVFHTMLFNLLWLLSPFSYIWFATVNHSVYLTGFLTGPFQWFYTVIRTIQIELNDDAFKHYSVQAWKWSRGFLCQILKATIISDDSQSFLAGKDKE